MICEAAAEGANNVRAGLLPARTLPYWAPYAIEILCFILVFFKKINKISGIINITVCENYT